MKTKICTNVAQSKKLMELGVDVNTADMYWWSSGKRYYIEAMDDGDFNKEDGHIPAWSLSTLLEFMPSINEHNIEYRPIIELYKDDGWACKYYNEETRNTNDIYIRRYGRTPLDAAFEMVCWLKENNKI